MVYSGNQEVDAFRYKKSREFDIKMAEDGYENPFWRDHELFRRFNKEKNPHKKLKIKAQLENTEDNRVVLVEGKKYISKKDYTILRNEYIALKVFNEYGWEEVQWDLTSGKLWQLQAQLLSEQRKKEEEET